MKINLKNYNECILCIIGRYILLLSIRTINLPEHYLNILCSKRMCTNFTIADTGLRKISPCHFYMNNVSFMLRCIIAEMQNSLWKRIGLSYINNREKYFIKILLCAVIIFMTEPFSHFEI